MPKKMQSVTVTYKLAKTTAQSSLEKIELGFARGRGKFRVARDGNVLVVTYGPAKGANVNDVNQKLTRECTRAGIALPKLEIAEVVTAVS